MTLDKILDIIQVISSSVLVIVIIIDIIDRRKSNGKQQ